MEVTQRKTREPTKSKGIEKKKLHILSRGW